MGRAPQRSQRKPTNISFYSDWLASLWDGITSTARRLHHPSVLTETCIPRNYIEFHPPRDVKSCPCESAGLEDW